MGLVRKEANWPSLLWPKLETGTKIREVVDYQSSHDNFGADSD